MKQSPTPPPQPITTPAARESSSDGFFFSHRVPDLFGVSHDCVNPDGHEPIASCGAVVCLHCERIFWR